MRYIVFTIILFCSLTFFGQTGRLTIHGRVQSHLKMLSRASIEVYKDNEMIDEVKSLVNGSFKLELKLGSVYNVTFKKEGYVNKTVAVVAKADSTINGRYFFQLDIDLLKVGEESDTSESVLPPVAKLYLKSQDAGFRYDKKYVKWILNEYEDLDD